MLYNTYNIYIIFKGYTCGMNDKDVLNIYLYSEGKTYVKYLETLGGEKLIGFHKMPVEYSETVSGLVNVVLAITFTAYIQMITQSFFFVLYARMIEMSKMEINTL